MEVVKEKNGQRKCISMQKELFSWKNRPVYIPKNCKLDSVFVGEDRGQKSVREHTIKTCFVNSFCLSSCVKGLVTLFL